MAGSESAHDERERIADERDRVADERDDAEIQREVAESSQGKLEGHDEPTEVTKTSES